MAIAELLAVVRPPSQPNEIADLMVWRYMERRLGIALPSDYRDFAEAYGTGIFNDPGRLCVSIWNPFTASYAEMLSGECDGLALRKACYSADEWPYEIFPSRPGLLPWGTDDNGCTLLWLTAGDPEQWPILLIAPGSAYMERIELQMTTFLARSFAGDLHCMIWSSPEFFSGPRPVKFAQRQEDIEYQ